MSAPTATAPTGRGGWTKRGFPAGFGPYYEWTDDLRPVGWDMSDDDHRAVNYAVISIQKRCHGIGFPKPIDYTGTFGELTDQAVRWGQAKLRVTVDGQFGPKTAFAFYWPVAIEEAHKVIDPLDQHAPPGLAAPDLAQIVGGIAQHESGWDPGAVGASTPADHGLVQINAPSNPTISIAQAFDHRFALNYCANRVTHAAIKYGGDLNAAIAEYASIEWADEWHATGAPPNPVIAKYVDFVRSWRPPT